MVTYRSGASSTRRAARISALFAHVRPRTHAAWAGTTLPAGGRADVNRTAPRRTPRPERSAAPAVDFTPTGTRAGRTSPNPDTTLPVGKAAAAQPSTALPSFKVRDVFDGKALVDSGPALALAAPGSVLDGAGEVLSIEQRGNNWVVVTTRGLIGTK